jgi:hypothetical protein
LVEQAIHFSPIKGKCLSQSLVLWYLLNRQGILSELCIGVKKDEDQLPFNPVNFNAHTWVEYQGEILNDMADVYDHYAAFNFPSRHA